MNRNDLPAPNANCEVCGTPYHRCSKCIKLRDKGIDTWKLHCDTSRCYQVLKAVEWAENRMIDAKEFNDSISEKLPDGREFTSDMIERINRILCTKDDQCEFDNTNEVYNEDTVEETDTENNDDGETLSSTYVKKSNKKIRHRAIQNVK